MLANGISVFDFFLCAMNIMSRSYICVSKLFSHTEKQTATHFHSHGLPNTFPWVAHGLHVGNSPCELGCLYFKPTTSKYGNSELPTSVPPTNSCPLSFLLHQNMESRLPTSGLSTIFCQLICKLFA